jgi:phosphate transport system substrate-binding protein
MHFPFFRLAHVLAGLLVLASSGRADQLRLFTSPALGQTLATLLPAMREAGVSAKISGEGSSATAIQMVAEGQADAAFSIRPMTGEDRAIAPAKPFAEVQIATQATAVLVSRDVWESGVRALSKEQLRQIYEQEIKNWKQVGGEDRPIKFYNYEHGQGVWEQFVQWIYGEIRRAPLGKFEIVVTGEDAHDTLQFNGGSISLAAPRWGDGKEVFALALRDETGAAVTPAPEHFADRTYPLARPVLVIFDEKPTGERMRMVDFLLGPKGRALLVKSSLIPVEPSAAK